MVRIYEYNIKKFKDFDEYEAAVDSGKIGEFDYSLIEDDDKFDIDGYCKAKTYATALKKLYKAALSAGADPGVLSLDDIMWNIEQAIRKRRKDLKIHNKRKEQDYVYAMFNPYAPSSKDRITNPDDGYSMGMDDTGYEETWWHKNPETGERYYFRLNIEPVDEDRFYVDLGYSKKAW